MQHHSSITCNNKSEAQSMISDTLLNSSTLTYFGGGGGVQRPESSFNPYESSSLNLLRKGSHLDQSNLSSLVTRPSTSIRIGTAVPVSRQQIDVMRRTSSSNFHPPTFISSNSVSRNQSRCGSRLRGIETASITVSKKADVIIDYRSNSALRSQMEAS